MVTIGFGNKMSKKMLNVPYVKQRLNYCGPTSLAMVMKYYGINITQDEVGEMANAKYFGVTIGQLVEVAKNKGLKAEIKKDISLADLVSSIDSDEPVIVAQHYCLGNNDIHFRVVIGYDNENNLVTVHDPEFCSFFSISQQLFLDLWHSQNFDHVALLVKKNKKEA